MITVKEIREAIVGLADNAPVTVRINEAPNDDIEIEFNAAQRLPNSEGGELIIYCDVLDAEMIQERKEDDEDNE